MNCYIVDSFATAPGAGNQAAVVLMPPDTIPTSVSDWMQNVAAEFNYSDTAFCWPSNDEGESDGTKGEIHWNVRFYTPAREVPLCGHASLAAAAVLFQEMHDPVGSTIVFHAAQDTLRMDLGCAPSGSTLRNTTVVMDFPAKPPQQLTGESVGAVGKMLKSAFACAEVPLFAGVSGNGDLFIELTYEAFSGIGYDNLDYRALLEWDGYTRGVIVSAACEPMDGNSIDDKLKADFVSRFFAPKAGIDEDPVTGSAHCTLCPYYSKKIAKADVIGRQTSKRGGVIACRLNGDRVALSGSATTTMSGTLWM